MNKNIILAFSGLLLGTFLAAANYHINIWLSLCLMFSVMSLLLFRNVIPGIVFAVASVYLSYGSIICMDSLIMLLLGYFIYRFVKNHSPEDGLFRNGLVVSLTSIMLYGLLPVYGVSFVCAHTFGNWTLLLPSLSIGALSLAALNASYVSEKTTRVFHTLWISIGFIAMIIYSCIRIFDPWHFLFLLMAPVFVFLLVQLWKKPEGIQNYEMKLAVSILLFSVLSGLGYIVYLF